MVEIILLSLLWPQHFHRWSSTLRGPFTSLRLLSSTRLLTLRKTDSKKKNNNYNNINSARKRLYDNIVVVVVVVRVSATSVFVQRVVDVPRSPQSLLPPGAPDRVVVATWVPNDWLRRAGIGKKSAKNTEVIVAAERVPPHVVPHGCGGRSVRFRRRFQDGGRAVRRETAVGQQGFAHRHVRPSSSLPSSHSSSPPSPPPTTSIPLHAQSTLFVRCLLLYNI